MVLSGRFRAELRQLPACRYNAEAIASRKWPRQLTTGAINACDFHGCGFADAQATGIHKREAGLVDLVPYAAKECADLSVRQDGGQTLLLGRADSFFKSSGQSRSSVL